MGNAYAITGKVVAFVCLICCLLLMPLANKGFAAEPIKIGAVLTVSGWGGFMGTPMKESLEAMVEDVNRKGGVLGRQLELFVEDDKSNPTNAVVSATKLIRDRKVAVIMGPTITDSGMAMIPVCEQEKVPFLAIGPLVSQLKKWTFLLGPGDARAAQHYVEYAVKTMGAKRLGIIHGTDNYGTTAAKVLATEVRRYPEASIVIEEKFELSDTNMVPQLTRIKSANPDLLMLYGAGTSAAVIAKNCKQLGMNVRVLGSSGVAIPEFAKLAGSIAEESKWVFLGSPLLAAERLSPSHPFRKNLYDPMKRAVKQKFGESKEMSIFYAGSFDGMRVLVEALKAAGSDDRGALRDALERIKLSDGLVGGYDCSPDDHQAAKKDPNVPLIIKNGEWTMLE
jgi:branched-chain amino acid transport system substrate-binding protein